jgi:hypothetical protein
MQVAVRHLDLLAMSDEPSTHCIQSPAHCLGDVAEFDHVQAALALFVLADERLGDIESSRYLDLGESSFTTESAQQLAQLLVLRRVDGLLLLPSAPRST